MAKDLEAQETTPLVDKACLTEQMSSQLRSEWEALGKLQKLAVIATTGCCIGVVFMVFVEGWSVLTSIYVIVQIITTIGYGDFTVPETGAKVFMSIFALFVLIYVAYILNKASHALLHKELQLIRTHLRQIQLGDPAVSARRLSTPGVFMNDPVQELKASAAIFLAFLAFGTIFYGTYESCTCSYGASEVVGCVETTFETCSRTGGFQKNFFESFYMSIITLTTIGFGDHTPRSYVGRAVGCVWMLFGVVATANFVDKLSKWFHEQNHKDRLAIMEDMSAETFQAMDKDGDGKLTRSEFLCYTLLQYGVVDEDMLDDTNSLFDKLVVVSEDDTVTLESIRALASR